MLYLWIFGDNVEDSFGHLGFVIFYLLAGIAATFAQYYFVPHSHVPNVGASGAIAGVLAAYIVMFPRGRVNVLLGNQIVTMPALIVIGLWIVLQAFSGVGSLLATEQTSDTGGVAYMAHLGGFAAGLLMTFFLRGRGEPSAMA
jgi:membrane associated rhomboid family serine protease